MKVTPNKHRNIVLFQNFPQGTTGSMTLTGADGSVVDISEGIKIQRYLADYFIPAEYITPSTLPLQVELKANGEVIRIVELAAPVTGPPIEDQSYRVDYSNGWSARPTDDATVVVEWFGGSPDTPPTGALAGKDKWYVPNLQGAVDE